MWRHIFFVPRNVSKDAAHDVGEAMISPRGEAKYFDLRLPEYVQDRQKKWFYIKDEPAVGQKYGLLPFDPMASVKKLKSSVKKKKLKSWDLPLTEAEFEETKPLMKKIQTFQTTGGKGLSRVQLITPFLRIRV
jgi:hypothetical protein